MKRWDDKIIQFSAVFLCLPFLCLQRAHNFSIGFYLKENNLFYLHIMAVSEPLGITARINSVLQWVAKSKWRLGYFITALGLPRTPLVPKKFETKSLFFASLFPGLDVGGTYRFKLCDNSITENFRSKKAFKSQTYLNLQNHYLFLKWGQCHQDETNGRNTMLHGLRTYFHE